MLHEQIKNALFCYFLFTCVHAPGYSAKTTQDMPSTRANTLSDDADDIQRQLDNEAKDRMKFVKPQTIWILHYPTSHGLSTSTESLQKSREDLELDSEKLSVQSKQKYNINSKEEQKFVKTLRKRTTCPCHENMICKGNITYKDVVAKFPIHTKGWNYKDQKKWHLSFTACGGTSQSPVNLPFRGLLRTKASREILFSKYNVKPKKMTIVRQGETVSLYGMWSCNRPFIYGGAAHSRRYIFHSLAIRRPSEHSVGGLIYPMETQALHVSVEYATLEDAICAAPKDKLALLMVANIYKHSNHSHEGLKELIDAVLSAAYRDVPMKPVPLKAFCPPLKEYAAYHGSLTTPPCTESVLWLVRAKPLPISRELVDVLEKKTYDEPGRSLSRVVQPLNDRNIYFFN